MSDFLRALSSFRKGALSSDALLREIDRQLQARTDDAVTMLAQLDEEHARNALPDGIHDAVSGRILHSLEVAGDSSGPSRVFPADDATQWFRDNDHSVTLLAEAEEPMRSVQWPLVSGGDSAHSFPRPSLPRKNAAPVSDGAVLKHRFKLVECVGEGGMGRVYKAIDLRRVEARQQDVHVAVKVLTRSFRDYSGSLAALQSEATKLQRLTHPNIVRVIDVDRDGQTVFMTMEYLSGQPLKRMLQGAEGKGLELTTALPILERIADALSYAHRNDIVHGDLKPSNVIVTDEGDVKVIDFGIARMMASPRRPATVQPGRAESETLSGLTPSYASPEMLEQEHPADPRDDVYALACITHELLTGEHPFERAAATAARDSGMRLRRHRALTRTQYRALFNGLRFDRAERTLTVERFMQELRGDRAASIRRIALYVVLAVLAVGLGAYFLTRARPAAVAASPGVGDVFRDCASCPLMKVLAPAKYVQGSADDDPDAQSFEKPRHAVVIARPIAFGEYEVTRAQYGAFVEETHRQSTGGCSIYDGEWTKHSELDWSRVGFAQTASHPATCVSWQDAKAYVSWLSAKTSHVYRLPSASEWEYAARAGSEGSRPWGASTKDACAAANVADESAAERFPGWDVHTCNDGYVFTAPVGAFAANAFGLNDMFGNVFEWVEDCWHDSYQGAPLDGSAWVGTGCDQREMRGGSWFTTPAFVRAAYRNRFEPDYRSNSIGFRVVRDMKE
jgi:formylglycine-generating enzyme required for sulfatase activity/predicted Ser/Thr protein kinase